MPLRGPTKTQFCKSNQTRGKTILLEPKSLFYLSAKGAPPPHVDRPSGLLRAGLQKQASKTIKNHTFGAKSLFYPSATRCRAPPTDRPSGLLQRGLQKPSSAKVTKTVIKPQYKSSCLQKHPTPKQNHTFCSQIAVSPSPQKVRRVCRKPNIWTTLRAPTKAQFCKSTKNQSKTIHFGSKSLFYVAPRECLADRTSGPHGKTIHCVGWAHKT